MQDPIDVFEDSKLFEALLSNTKTVNGCWEWQGALYWDGYGQKMCRVNGKKFLRRTHRLVWEIIHGKPNHHICHKCDNPKCINPAHLFDGTMSENMVDMHKKGRGKKLHQCARGERIAKAKLNEEKVRQIRILLSSGRSVTSLAKEYNIGRTAISSIKHNHTWKHVIK